MITVTIKTILHFKAIFGAETTLPLPEASTLIDLLMAMADKWGEPFKTQIFQPGADAPHQRVRLLINGRDIEFLDGLDTQLHGTDDVLIMPPIAGG